MKNRGASVYVVDDDVSAREALVGVAAAADRAVAESERGREARKVAGIVGTSKPLQAALRKIETVAATDATVLIQGETGTGKERFARAVHELSPRRKGPFVQVNCAAIPAALLESELLGHERGAFTGAVARRLGRFELAQGGTLFLDEIGELPVELQPKLLRVLQEHEFERLGGAQTVHSNARVVAATNRNLKSMVAARTFREDLYYRLNVFPVVAPPLRERKEDIPLLARHFMNDLAQRLGRPAKAPPEAFLERLLRHSWPGNVRELQNVVERAAIMPEADDLDLDAPDEMAVEPPAPAPSPASHAPGELDVAAFIRAELSLPAAGDVYAKIHQRVDRVLLKLALEHTRGNRREAARLMGISRQTMQTRLRSLRIHVGHSVEADAVGS